jgi:hypothetical protein
MRCQTARNEALLRASCNGDKPLTVMRVLAAFAKASAAE